MKLREPFVRRHICTWVRSLLHADDIYGLSGYEIERKCTDCGKRQMARISKEDKESLPDSVLHLGGFNWRDES